MKIAIIGAKGIPAKHGGIERHVEEIAVRLADRGHKVTVFGRHYYKPQNTGSIFDYKGVRIVYLPCLPIKNLDAITYALGASTRALRQDFDIYHFQAVGPSSLSFLPKIFGKKVVCTIHSKDYRRSKWGKFAKLYLKFGEKVAFRFAQAIITVSKTLKKELESEYKRSVYYIPNSFNLVEPDESPQPEILEKYNLSSGNYILFVGRLIPEKGVHYLLTAFQNISTNCKLVIAGGTSFTDDYVRKIKALADEKVIFTDYIYGRDLATLYRHCCFVVLPSELEGLPITLLEAMSLGKAVLTSNIPENMEVIAPDGQETCGFSFQNKDIMDLEEKLKLLLENPDRREEKGRLAKEHVQRKYNWDIIAEQTEEVYRKVLYSSKQNQ